MTPRNTFLIQIGCGGRHVPAVLVHQRQIDDRPGRHRDHLPAGLPVHAGGGAGDRHRRRQPGLRNDDAHADHRLPRPRRHRAARRRPRHVGGPGRRLRRVYRAVDLRRLRHRPQGRLLARSQPLPAGALEVPRHSHRLPVRGRGDLGSGQRPTGSWCRRMRPAAWSSTPTCRPRRATSWRPSCRVSWAASSKP